MAIFNVLSSTNADPRVNTGSSVFIGAQIRIETTGLIGQTVMLTGSQQSATVMGSVLATFVSGVLLGDQDTDSGHRLILGSSGSIFSNMASGVLANSLDVWIQNSGTIIGRDAITLSGGSDQIARIENRGLMLSSDEGIVVTLGAGTALDIENWGQIIVEGGGAAIVALNSVLGERDTVRNHGEITGNVLLYSGDDVYDGRGGFVRGTVSAGGGNDRLIAGSRADSFNGGEGTDTLDFSLGSAVRLSLTGAFAATGAAAGDVYSGFEIILGSATGGDKIGGGTTAELLRGLGGADHLGGASGADTVEGGAGRDTMSGGAGNDRFRFALAAEGGDVISDFANLSGNNDAFQFRGAAFAGLLAGNLDPLRFQSRGDNVAQDSNDRFIFRTSDKTLWFDANGNGAGGLTLMADLQASATVTVGDILIY
jgi:Ca2+-binding RTX toxin-like protein